VVSPRKFSITKSPSIPLIKNLENSENTIAGIISENREKNYSVLGENAENCDTVVKLDIPFKLPKKNSDFKEENLSEIRVDNLSQNHQQPKIVEVYRTGERCEKEAICILLLMILYYYENQILRDTRRFSRNKTFSRFLGFPLLSK